MAHKINLNDDYSKKIKLFFESHENHINNKKLFKDFNIQNIHDAYEFQNKFNEFQFEDYFRFDLRIGYKIEAKKKFIINVDPKIRGNSSCFCSPTRRAIKI